MSSPWRFAVLLPLLAVQSSPGVTGCIAGNCTDYVDAELPGGEVTITLRNAGAATLFVPAGEGCGWHPFTIEQGGDERKWFRGACDWSCEDVLDSCECAADCAANSLIQIDPGASYELTWDLALYVEENLSLDCPAEGCPTKCSRQTVAGDGDYRITAEAGTACADATGCTCTPAASSCTVYAELDGVPTLTAEATLTLPGESVELVFH